MIKELFISIFSLAVVLNADIQLIKKENNDSNKTLLVIGGIHGDEPGGYFAASVLATRYDIKSKNLWIVPNLNKKSIQNNIRGIHGDMNRKFAAIQNDDKDKNIVEEIKDIITQDKISLVLNLHDGNGFYRKTDKGRIFNPNAWGQTCVIDQCDLDKTQEFGDLGNIALSVKNSINKKLIEGHHTFDVRNTNTKFDDEAMQLSLTYYAVTHNKPAFAIESSKNLSSLSQKVFYHLLAIEEFMNIMNIKFEREFELNEKNIEKILRERGKLTINNNFSIDLTNIKKSLSFVPIKSNDNRFDFTDPLGSIVEENGSLSVYTGNEKVTVLFPQYFNMNVECSEKFEVVADGFKVPLNKSSDIIVKDYFNIVGQNGYRVNVIGFVSKDSIDESGISIKLKDFDKRFSIDKDNRVYRVEFYKNNEFCHMSKVHFIQDDENE